MSTPQAPRKVDDPRYVPGVGGWDEAASDEEWRLGMGPAPAQDAPDHELGPVCEGCTKYLPDNQIATKTPRILCEGCMDEEEGMA